MKGCMLVVIIEMSVSSALKEILRKHCMSDLNLYHKGSNYTWAMPWLVSLALGLNILILQQAYLTFAHGNIPEEQTSGKILCQTCHAIATYYIKVNTCRNLLTCRKFDNLFDHCTSTYMTVS